MDKFEDAFKKISKVNLATHIELWGEPKTEKLYFEAGWQSRQAEINQLQSQINEMAEVGLNQESVIREKDKRIENFISSWRKQAKESFQDDQRYIGGLFLSCIDELEKTLRGEHE